MIEEFFIKKPNNDMKKYETLATFYCENTRKHYLIFTDNTTDHDNRLHIYASVYLPNQNEFRLFPIKNETEWEYIDAFIKSYLLKTNGSL